MPLLRESPRRLAEREGKPIALRWIDAACAALRASPGAPLTRAAIAIAFKTNDPDPAFVARVIETLERSRRVLETSRQWFHDASARRASRLFGASEVPPAYAVFGEGIWFTPAFAPYHFETGRGFGPMCRAAMVLHESVHVFDARSGELDIHVSEWDEPRFSAQTPEQSLHNPSAYACFAAQVHQRVFAWPPEARFGAGRRAD
jgi:hypothetical protein